MKSNLKKVLVVAVAAIGVLAMLLLAGCGAAPKTWAEAKAKMAVDTIVGSGNIKIGSKTITVKPSTLTVTRMYNKKGDMRVEMAGDITVDAKDVLGALSSIISSYIKEPYKTLIADPSNIKVNFTAVLTFNSETKKYKAWGSATGGGATLYESTEADALEVDEVATSIVQFNMDAASVFYDGDAADKTGNVEGKVALKQWLDQLMATANMKYDFKEGEVTSSKTVDEICKIITEKMLGTGNGTDLKGTIDKFIDFGTVNTTATKKDDLITKLETEQTIKVAATNVEAKSLLSNDNVDYVIEILPDMIKDLLGSNISVIKSGLGLVLGWISDTEGSTGLEINFNMKMKTDYSYKAVKFKV